MLVTLECRQAAAWIAARLAEGVPPADIMVLARRRDRLGVMEDELRALHIPAQQPEKSELGEAPEVQDIVALLDVLVSPTHDLSLARALKSPLFNVADEALVQIALAARSASAEGAPRPWFELVRNGRLPPPVPEGLAATLVRWKDWVDTLPPHDALEAIYEDGDVLARFGAAAPAALRNAVLGNLRALLGAALQVDGGRYATPYGFVRALKAGGIPAPAQAAEGAVRLLTVHGAKGLEAPTVLMLDTDGPPPKAETMGVIVEWPGESPAPWRFAFLASETRAPACSTDALEVEMAARQREELNALYVAMTRARNQLVISSVQPHIAAETSWWQRLAEFCEPLAAPQAPLRAPMRRPSRDRFRCRSFPPSRSRPGLPPLRQPRLQPPRASHASVKQCIACWSSMCQVPRHGRRPSCCASRGSSGWMRRPRGRPPSWRGASSPVKARGPGTRRGWTGRAMKWSCCTRASCCGWTASCAAPASGGCSTTSRLRARNRIRRWWRRCGSTARRWPMPTPVRS